MTDLRKKYEETQLDLITTVAGELSREDIAFALDEHVRATKAYVEELVNRPALVRLHAGTARA
jgi:hypothetical protein